MGLPEKPNEKQPSLAKWRFVFAYRGRKYRVFKRVDSKNAPYYIHIQREKKRTKQTLETPERTVAVNRAKRFVDLVLGSKWDEVAKIKVRHRVGTLEDVLRIYRKIHGIKPRSARSNKLSMLLIVRRCTGKEKADPKRVSLNYLDRSLAIRFQDLTAVDYCAGLNSKDEAGLRESRERAFRSSRSTLNQARSIFSRRADHDLMVRYKDAGLHIPDCVSEFMTVKLRGSKIKTDYNTPGDFVIKETFEQIEKIVDRDPNVYRAFWLAVGAGLRRGEMHAVDWSHFIEKDGLIWISGGIGKNGRKIEVPLQSRAWKSLEPFRKARGPIIEGETIEWSKRLNNWLKFQGWATEKKMHELRAYVGSLIYRQNPQAAMAFMRHKSITITERFYVRYGAGKPVDVL